MQYLVEPEKCTLSAEIDTDHAVRLVHVSPSPESPPWLVKHTRRVLQLCRRRETEIKNMLPCDSIASRHRLTFVQDGACRDGPRAIGERRVAPENGNTPLEEQ